MKFCSFELFCYIIVLILAFGSNNFKIIQEKVITVFSDFFMLVYGNKTMCYFNLTEYGGKSPKGVRNLLIFRI